MSLTKELLEQYEKEKKITLNIKVITKSNETKIVDKLGENKIKVKVSAVPEKGKANKELIRYFASVFKVKKSQVKIIIGETNNEKVIEIK